MISGSNPTLAYMHRRYLARRLVSETHPGRFLEIGVGTGRFYEELEARGFSGLCLDLNQELIQEHQSRRETASSRIDFLCQDFFSLRDSFDLILAFEVLEHYQEDVECLRKWKSLLAPDGTLVFSVPAHMQKWTQNDTLAGHARRYEKTDLLGKLIECGLRVQDFWCYGFPLLNWTYPFSQWLRRSWTRLQPTGPPYAQKKSAAGWEGMQQSTPRKITGAVSASLMRSFEKTEGSGKPKFQWLSLWAFNETLWWPALQLQRPFMGNNYGIGYIVKCQTFRGDGVR